MPEYFLFKLILTPLIVAGATLSARRWGDSIGGWIIGIPLTSGPVSVFFALEQGPAFAASAAQGAILGVVAVSVFCTAYFYGARPGRPWQGALAALTGYAPAMWLISRSHLALGWTLALALSALVVALLLMRRPAASPVAALPAAWDLPLRMVTATVILVGITAVAGSLGPLWSGLLSPFPIFTFVLAVFSQSQSGVASAQRVVRGVVTGLFGYATFFLVVGLLITRLPLPAVYALATLAALSVNASSLVVMIARRRAAAEEQATTDKKCR